MNGAFFASVTGRASGLSLKQWLVVWAVAEFLALLLAIRLFGVGATLLLMFVTSVLGIAVLRRVGLGAARQLRRSMAGGAAGEVFVDGSLTALGALLLIMPGFVSDIVGLALATPSIRQRIAARFLKPFGPTPSTATRHARPGVIDLGPDDWRVIERSGRD